MCFLKHLLDIVDTVKNIKSINEIFHGWASQRSFYKIGQRTANMH